MNFCFKYYFRPIGSPANSNRYHLFVQELENLLSSQAKFNNTLFSRKVQACLSEFDTGTGASNKRRTDQNFSVFNPYKGIFVYSLEFYKKNQNNEKVQKAMTCIADTISENLLKANLSNEQITDIIADYNTRSFFEMANKLNPNARYGFFEKITFATNIESLFHSIESDPTMHLKDIDRKYIRLFLILLIEFIVVFYFLLKWYRK